MRLSALGSAEIRLERDEPTGKFLLYAPTEEPDYEDDWLLDIRLYSRSFRADKASILLQELGLVNLHLRTHVADRRKFFDAKDRLQRIKNLVAPDDAATDLDRKMIAVVAKARQPELFNLLRTIFHAWTEAGSDLDLGQSACCVGPNREVRPRCSILAVRSKSHSDTKKIIQLSRCFFSG